MNERFRAVGCNPRIVRIGLLGIVRFSGSASEATCKWRCDSHNGCTAFFSRKDITPYLLMESVENPTVFRLCGLLGRPAVILYRYRRYAEKPTLDSLCRLSGRLGVKCYIVKRYGY